jgi:metal-responsive CopG/Arc/MetJ family transcriptional regulator
LTSIDKRGIICCMDRISVSVPTELIQDLRRRPEAYGVAELRSEAARLQKLLQVGAQTSLRRVEEAAMVATYREWSGDKERREAVVTLADTLLAEGGFADGLLRGQQRQRG